MNAGETYFLQFGSMWGYANWIQINFYFISPPSNDNFTDALRD